MLRWRGCSFVSFRLLLLLLVWKIAKGEEVIAGTLARHNVIQENVVVFSLNDRSCFVADAVVLRAQGVDAQNQTIHC
ncbi:hypothetical protein D3C80_2105920 [compost metagenome]